MKRNVIGIDFNAQKVLIDFCDLGGLCGIEDHFFNRFLPVGPVGTIVLIVSFLEDREA